MGKHLAVLYFYFFYFHLFMIHDLNLWGFGAGSREQLENVQTNARNPGARDHKQSNTNPRLQAPQGMLHFLH